MEKEFVPYKPSLRLKAIGFDEPCFGYHLTKDLPYVKRGLKFGSEKYVGKHNSYDDFIVSAPTFSQAFRFFREKYGYCHFINHSGNGFCSGFEDLGNNEHGFENYNTYEEAELACLNKLIEIVEGIES